MELFDDEKVEKAGESAGVPLSVHLRSEDIFTISGHSSIVAVQTIDSARYFNFVRLTSFNRSTSSYKMP